MGVLSVGAVQIACDRDGCNEFQLLIERPEVPHPLPDGWYEMWLGGRRLVYHSRQHLVREVLTSSVEQADGPGRRVSDLETQMFREQQGAPESSE